jgi:hypothetical protein
MISAVGDIWATLLSRQIVSGVGSCWMLDAGDPLVDLLALFSID